jgi:hypothetical protein
MNDYKPLNQRIAHRISRPVALGLLAFAIRQPAPTNRSSSTEVTKLSWLAGCWVEDLGVLRIEDEWGRPVGHTMLGVSRTLQGDSVIELELRTLTDSAGRLELTRISSVAKTRLNGDAPTPALLQFVDSTNPYPHVVSYREEGPDHLVVRHEGTKGGKHRAMEDLFDRASCGAKFEKPLE